MTIPVPSITLNNGVHMPILGFGVFQIPDADTEQAVTDALAAGDAGGSDSLIWPHRDGLIWPHLVGGCGVL